MRRRLEMGLERGGEKKVRVFRRGTVRAFDKGWREGWEACVTTQVHGEI